MDAERNHEGLVKPPWKERTRQQDGRVTERRILTDRGAYVHPNSGAGDIKDDGHDDMYVYEVKDTDAKTFRLIGKELKTTYVRAVRQGRLAMWLIHFNKLGFTAEIRLVPNGRETIDD